MDNNELFIEKYKELEYAIQKRYNLPKSASEIPYLERKEEFQKYKKELEYCREVRNFLQHENKINNEFAVIASDEMIKVLDTIINKVNNPLKLKDICIPFNKIYYRGLNDCVLESILAMNHHLYTHIPILDNKKVVGVLSKTSIFDYILDLGIDNLNKDLLFKDITKYLNIDNECYLFRSKNYLVSDMTNLIADKFKQGKRIEMVFVTSTGDKFGNLEGILTPYDILEY